MCYHLFSHEAQGQNEQNSLTVWMGFHCSYVTKRAHNQWEASILMLINTFAPSRFRIVEMDN